MHGLQCFKCKNYYGLNHCLAFPDEEEIPQDIYEDEFEHTKKHPEQKNDILFEPIKEGGV